MHWKQSVPVLCFQILWPQSLRSLVRSVTLIQWPRTAWLLVKSQIVNTLTACVTCRHLPAFWSIKHVRLMLTLTTPTVWSATTPFMNPAIKANGRDLCLFATPGNAPDDEIEYCTITTICSVTRHMTLWTLWAFCHPSWQQLNIVQIEPQNVWKYLISPQETSLPLMNICHVQSPVISRSEHLIKWTYGHNSTVLSESNTYKHSILSNLLNLYFNYFRPVSDRFVTGPDWDWLWPVL